MGPSNGVFRLPDVVIEVLGVYRGPEVTDVGIAELDGQESVETGRVTVADTEGIAELTDAGIPRTCRCSR